MEERRKSKRLKLKVTIQLERIDEGDITTIRYVVVDVKDVSKSGIGFRCSQELGIGGLYETKLKIWTNEVIHTIVKIVRCEKKDGMFEYGGYFVGMMDADVLKIGIYQLIDEQENI